MKIALVQMNIIWEDKDKNYIKAEEYISKAAGEGIKTIFFSEMSFTGFSMHTDVTGEDDNATINAMSLLASKYDINVGFGWVKKIAKSAENHYTIVSATKAIISDYAKIHPFTYSGEDEFFTGGDKITEFEIESIPFSNFICYDLRFPEVFRMVVPQAHAIVIPAAWPKRRSAHWKALLKARAIENQVYIIAVNCYGTIDGLEYSGDSCVINPNGEYVATIEGEGMLCYDLNDDVEEYRNAFPVLNDIRNDVYMK